MGDLSFGGIDPAAEAGGGGIGGVGGGVGGTGSGKDKSMDPAKMQQLVDILQKSKSQGPRTPGSLAPPPGAAGGSPGMPGFGPPSFSNLMDRLVRYKGAV